eukprot:scaffold128_cov248-Pinguiococcus_pyrenoidosus.AAC.23
MGCSASKPPWSIGSVQTRHDLKQQPPTDWNHTRGRIASPRRRRPSIGRGIGTSFVAQQLRYWVPFAALQVECSRTTCFAAGRAASVWHHGNVSATAGWTTV